MALIRTQPIQNSFNSQHTIEASSLTDLISVTASCPRRHADYELELSAAELVLSKEAFTNVTFPFASMMAAQGK